MSALGKLRRLFGVLSEQAFAKLWMEQAHRISAYCEEEFPQRALIESVDLEDQYVKVAVDDATVFVISRQVPKREIWYSSPVSGPSHFALKGEDGKWQNAQGRELFALLQDDLAKAVQKKGK